MEESAGNPRAASAHGLPARPDDTLQADHRTKPSEDFSEAEPRTPQSPEESQRSEGSPDGTEFTKNIINQEPITDRPRTQQSRPDHLQPDLQSIDQEEQGRHHLTEEHTPEDSPSKDPKPPTREEEPKLEDSLNCGTRPGDTLPYSEGDLRPSVGQDTPSSVGEDTPTSEEPTSKERDTWQRTHHESTTLPSKGDTPRSTNSDSPPPRRKNTTQIPREGSCWPSAEDTLPLPTEDTPPVPTQDILPLPTEDTPPLPTQDILPLPTEDTPPLPTEDTPPLPTEDTPPVPTEDILPLLTEDTPPVPTEDILPLLTEDTPPLPTQNILPLPTEDILPLPTQDTPPVPTEDILPLPTQDILPLPTEDTPPLPTEDTPPLPTEDTPPVPTEDTPSSFTGTLREDKAPSSFYLQADPPHGMRENKLQMPNEGKPSPEAPPLLLATKLFFLSRGHMMPSGSVHTPPFSKRHVSPVSEERPLSRKDLPLKPEEDKPPQLQKLTLGKTPPPPLLVPEQTPPPPHLGPEQTPPPPHLVPEQTPPPPHLGPEQTPPPPHLGPEQTPPPPHLDQSKTPPPPADQQIHLSSPSTNMLTFAPLAPPLTIEVFCDQAKLRPLVSPSGEPKLCGYLEKQGGPLRAWKQRWFTYEEKKNQLFYYRTPQDVTPLGCVELCGATFTYPLNAERGTFHIKTPERTFVLKALTQDLMLYWLQQLQIKRWQHRQTTTCSDPTNTNNSPDDFLPVLRSPLGLVGEEAANASLQRTPLTNMSIKHPLIEIQNSVHSLRKRSSQDMSQSVFHLETPVLTLQSTTFRPAFMASRTLSEPQTPPSALSLAESTGQISPTERRRSKTRSSSSMTLLRRDRTANDRTSRLLQDKQMLLEEVKAQKELVLILHKALEASQLEKRTCAEFLAVPGEQERLELLRHRERQVADLKTQLAAVREEVEAARRNQAENEAQVVELKENVRLLEERNNARQEVIIKLSNQLTTVMSEPHQSREGGLDCQEVRQLRQQIDNLKDDLAAYQTQTRYLNSEIQQLTRLWRRSSEQEKTLMVKCAHLEASNCQVESQYLNILRQLQEVKDLDPVHRTAIQKMIEDALRGELKNSMKLNQTRDHDEYGFKIIPDYEVEDMKLLAKIQALEIRSHNLLQQEGGERPLLARWAQYLAGRSDSDLVPSPELKGLLRAGVPQVYRQQVWSWLVRARTRTIRDHHPQRYQQLCEKSRTSPNPACRQIQLDLHRTLTTNQHFSSPSSPALQQLRRILLAFSWQNPAIGYCQGLNRLAAIALLVLQSEEDAFWCLVAVVESIMPQDYYTKNLTASQADQRVLKDLLSEKLPRLSSHLDSLGVDVSLITFTWFLCVFVENLPSDILLPLWDAFLYEGTKVIFRYTLALFKYKEDDLLKIRDSVEMYQYLRFFTKTISDTRKLISIAFVDMNPFPGRLLRNRRAFHLERLQGELRELEEQQRAFVTESAERKDKELDAGVSEDEDL